MSNKFELTPPWNKICQNDEKVDFGQQTASKQPANHKFDGQNTQHLGYFPSKQKEFNFCNYNYLVSAVFLCFLVNTWKKIC